MRASREKGALREFSIRRYVSSRRSRPWANPGSRHSTAIVSAAVSSSRWAATSDSRPKKGAKIGLPEFHIGSLPALGGTREAHALCRASERARHDSARQDDLGPRGISHRTRGNTCIQTTSCSSARGISRKSSPCAHPRRWLRFFVAWSGRKKPLSRRSSRVRAP